MKTIDAQLKLDKTVQDLHQKSDEVQDKMDDPLLEKRKQRGKGNRSRKWTKTSPKIARLIAAHKKAGTKEDWASLMQVSCWNISLVD